VSKVRKIYCVRQQEEWEFLAETYCHDKYKKGSVLHNLGNMLQLPDGYSSGETRKERLQLLNERFKKYRPNS
jgi:hypothetical protein